MLVGGVLLGAAAIGAGVLALADDDDGDDPPTEAELAQQRAEQIEAVLTESDRDGQAGIAISHPPQWKSSKRGGIINVESPDRCLVVSVSAPARASQAAQLKRDATAVLEQAFGKTREERLARSEIDGLPTEGSLIAGRDRRGNAIVVRQGVSRGERYAYVTQTLYRAPPCPEASPVADLIIENLELSK